jgi:hypothetical protein
MIGPFYAKPMQTTGMRVRVRVHSLPPCDPLADVKVPFLVSRSQYLAGAPSPNATLSVTHPINTPAQLATASITKSSMRA